MTVNRCADVDQYPLPNAEDLFATLSGGKIFSKIDLSHAYQQVELGLGLGAKWSSRGFYRSDVALPLHHISHVKLAK